MNQERPTDIQGFEFLTNRYTNYLLVHNYSQLTVRQIGYRMKAFADWAADMGVTRPKDASKGLFESYKRYLYYRGSHRDGDKLNPNYVRGVLSVLKNFLKWCVKEGAIDFNPMSELELPKRNKNVIRSVLTHEQVEDVLNGIDLSCSVGFRDRAIMETIYSSGIRRSELVALDINDLNKQKGYMLIRSGKGNKDRLIPVGQRAIEWIEKYEVETRSLWVNTSCTALFVTKYGKRISSETITKMARKYFDSASVKTKGAAHVYRHSMATTMLNAGVDLRHIQEMLGHDSIQSTQIYTKVAIEKLKEVHEKSHPAKSIRDKK